MRANLFIALIGMLCVAGCGGGGSSLAAGGSGTGTGGTGGVGGAGNGTSNVQAVVLDAGPSASTSPQLNAVYTTVTVCVPGSTTQCQTFDHIQVDTQSEGFRLLTDAGLTLSLPQMTDSGGNDVTECVPFADGSSYGSVRKADVKIAGETAAGIEVHVIGDTNYTGNIPSTCSGKAENTVATFGANGIIGVGSFVSDCGPTCSSDITNTNYYTCPPSSNVCSQALVAESAQVSNPVAFFATDNNGIILQLPMIAAAGQTSATGSLIFGIGTQTNNGLTSSVHPLEMSSADGSFTTNFAGTTGLFSVIDSGSTGFYFTDPNIPKCTNQIFYCPASTLSETAQMEGADGTAVSMPFSVSNEESFGNGVAVAPGISADLSNQTSSQSGLNPSQSFVWGVPFFFGRNVYFSIAGATNTGTSVPSPYVAF